MSSRRVKLVLLCEDNQHEAFTRRFLKGMGWNTREIRVEKSPSAGGSAECWVRINFTKELGIYRARKTKAASALVTMLDADKKTVQGRIMELESECQANHLEFRTNDEAVAVIVPKRNIETWIHYLKGNRVNEEDVYPKLPREKGCKPSVDALVSFCRTSGLNPDAPNSLILACNEYDTRIKGQNKPGVV
jgi:hypothetical protein